MDCSLAGRVVARDVGRDANWLEKFSQFCIQKITVLYMISWYFLGFVKELSYFPFRISYLNLESAEVIGLIVLSAANFCWKLRGLPTCRCCLYPIWIMTWGGSKCGSSHIGNTKTWPDFVTDVWPDSRCRLRDSVAEAWAKRTTRCAGPVSKNSRWTEHWSLRHDLLTNGAIETMWGFP